MPQNSTKQHACAGSPQEVMQRNEGWGAGGQGALDARVGLLLRLCQERGTDHDPQSHEQGKICFEIYYLLKPGLPPPAMLGQHSRPNDTPG